MRFQFCGNNTCPQWFISEISVLTKITAVKMKLIFNQLIMHYLQSSHLVQFASKQVTAKIGKLLNNTGLDIYEMNAVVSTLNFILHNCIRFHTNDTILHKQLIDLGLPKQNVESITKSFKSHREKLLQKSLDMMYRGKHIMGMNYSIHQFLGSQKLGSKAIRPIKFVEMQLKQGQSAQYYNKNQQNVQKSVKQHNFIICEQELDQLIYQLEQALSIYQKIETQK